MGTQTPIRDDTNEDYSSYGQGVVEAALLDGLSEDLTGIDPHAVRRNLRKNSRKAYTREMAIWNAYVAKFPGRDPRDMRVMKHFAEVIGRGIKARLEAKLAAKPGDEVKNKKKRASTWSVRNKMRRFYNMWERQMHLDIADEVKESMAPYIEGELADKLGLSRERKTPTFFTIESYVSLQLHHWVSDPHDYKHEGSRVDATNLLNNHCFTSARLQEVCGAKYQDLICLIGWKDGQPDIKLDFKRKICKGLDYKQPEHPLAERLIGPDGLPPPLFAQPMVHWLVNIISSGALRDYKTIEEVLSAFPEEGESFCFLEWADDMLDMPVFPEWSESGPKPKAKNDKAWGNQVSQWAKRAGFLLGLAIHAIRREILIKVNDSGASIGQVMKFAAQRNIKTLQGHYLHDLTTIDGAACFLGMQPRNDLTEDFRTATMKRNPDLQQSLPSRMKEELENRDEYVALTGQIENLTLQIKAAENKKTVSQLKDERAKAYKSRAKLQRDEWEKFRQSQKRVPKAQREAHRQSDWRRTHFDRIRHMMPERDRLARNMSLRVPLRSPEGISVMRDLIALRTGDCQVAYQDVLRPVESICPVPHCGTNVDSLSHSLRWKHVFDCYESFLKRTDGYAQFCFICSEWVNSEKKWEHHCQAHIDNQDIPSRCDPVIFRHAVACAGYCPVHLGNEGLPAHERLQQFTDRSAWRRHISRCVPGYVRSVKSPDSISCPLSCPVSFHSEADLWHHLGDVHSAHMPDALKKRKSCVDEDDKTPGTAKKRKTTTTRTVRFVNTSPRDTNTTVFIPRVSASSNPSLSINSDSRNARDRSVTPTSMFSASEQDDTDSGTSTPLSSLFDSEPLDMQGRDAALAAAPIEPAVPMELIHPDLRNDISSLGFAEATATNSIGSEGEPRVLTAIDEEQDIWEVEALLARWKQGRRVVYLVKWKGFPDEANTWEKRTDINAEMVDEFDAVYLEQRGNHEGVELLDKRMRLGKVEYLVRWKGRPSTENSWEKELTISYERVREFEACIS